MSVVRIVFLGTPDFAVAQLESLHKDPHFSVVRVYTQPDKPSGRHLKVKPTPVKEKALELGLDVKNVENINAPEVLQEIADLKADAAVVVAFGQILKPEFMQLFTHGAVNIHSSLLPRWRGAAPMQRALMAGDAETGVALQIVVPKLDAGAVLGVRRVALTDDVDILKLYEILKQKSCELLEIEFMDYIRGNLMGEPQDESQVTIAKKIKKEEGLIDWKLSARQIFNNLRGLKSWPGVWTLREGKVLKVLEASPIDSKSTRTAEVLAIGDTYFDVACGQGALRIYEVQPESRAGMKVADYLRGYHLKVGDVLGG